MSDPLVKLWDEILGYYASRSHVQGSKAERALEAYRRIREGRRGNGITPVTIEHPYHILKTLRLYEYFTGRLRRPPFAERLRVIKDAWETCLPWPHDFLEFQMYLTSLFIYVAVKERGYPALDEEFRRIPLSERLVVDLLNILVNSWETAGLLGYAVERWVLGDLLMGKLKPGWTHLALSKRERGPFYTWLEALHDLAAGMALISSGPASWSRYLQLSLSAAEFTPKRKPGQAFLIAPTLLGFWAWRTVELLRQEKTDFSDVLKEASRNMLPYLRAVSATVNELFERSKISVPFTSLVEKLKSMVMDAELLELTFHADLFMISDLLNSILNEASIEGYRVRLALLLERGYLEMERVEGHG